MRISNAALYVMGAGSAVSDAVLYLMYAQLALIAVCLMLFAIFMLRKYLVRKRSNEMLVAQTTVGETKEHTLIGISLDISRVKRNFNVGDTFDCDGLAVIAEYKEQPVTENIYDFSISEPMLFAPGTEVVTVGYGGYTATYTVNVEQAVPEAPSRTLLYIELNVDEVKTQFKEGEPFDMYGLKVFAHYNAAPEVEQVFDFTVDEPDMTAAGRTEVVVHYGDFAQTYPIFIERKRTLVGIELDLSIVRREFVLGERFYSDGLIVVATYDVAPFNERVSDYQVDVPDMETEGQHVVTVKYLDASAIYTITVIKPETSESEVAASEQKVIYEESVDAGILRYDRSFTARLIQSDDETKHWYTLIKNELLSYKKIKARMSWKKESFKFGKEIIAKFGFRGKTLCLSLALDPADYIDSKYKLEDVSENKSFIYTPSMYRIKNSRRVKYAIELIQTIMERIGAKRIEDRIAEDYYLPYEGLVQLIDKKLVKRIIKSGADEVIFRPSSEIDDQSDETVDGEEADSAAATLSDNTSDAAGDNTDDTNVG